MKKQSKTQKHPQSSPVVFRDAMTGDTFLVQSTMASADSIVWEDGKTYPLVNVEITSRSHPAFTGKEKAERSTSRGQAFKEKYAKSLLH